MSLNDLRATCRRVFDAYKVACARCGDVRDLRSRCAAGDTRLADNVEECAHLRHLFEEWKCPRRLGVTPESTEGGHLAMAHRMDELAKFCRTEADRVSSERRATALARREELRATRLHKKQTTTESPEAADWISDEDIKRDGGDPSQSGDEDIQSEREARALPWTPERTQAALRDFETRIDLLSRDIVNDPFSIFGVEERFVVPAIDGTSGGTLTPPVALYPGIAARLARSLEAANRDEVTHAALSAIGQRVANISSTPPSKLAVSFATKLVLNSSDSKTDKKKLRPPSVSVSYRERKAQTRADNFAQTVIEAGKGRWGRVTKFQPGLTISEKELKEPPQWHRSVLNWGVSDERLRLERATQSGLWRWISELRTSRGAPSGSRDPYLEDKLKILEDHLVMRRKLLSVARRSTEFRYGHDARMEVRFVSSTVDMLHIRQLLVSENKCGLAVMYDWDSSYYVLFIRFEQHALGQADVRQVGTDREIQEGLDQARISYTLSHAEFEPGRYRLLLRLLRDDQDGEGGRPWYITEQLWQLTRGVSRIPAIKLRSPAKVFRRGVCARRGFDEIFPHLLFIFLWGTGVANATCAVSVIVDLPDGGEEGIPTIHARSDAAWIVDQNKMESAFTTSALHDRVYTEQLCQAGSDGSENAKRLLKALLEERYHGERILAPITSRDTLRAELEQILRRRSRT